MIREDSIWRTRRSFTFVTAREVAYSKQGAYFFLFIYFFFERQQIEIKALNFS